MTGTVDPAAASCPVPLVETERVLLGHGSGGQLSAELIRYVIVPALGAAAAGGVLQDAAVVALPASAALQSGAVVVSTDSFVVSPLVFPGGDIGSLAVHGTVNDLAMRGAVPIALTAALVIEEGMPIETLRAIVTSMGVAAAACGVTIVAGDTKVVGRGAADQMFVTTAGVGCLLDGAQIGADRVQARDAVLLSGPIGLHGTTVLSVREGLGFESAIASDSQPLHRLVAEMVAAGGADVHALRDPTRGGLASALNEIAAASRVAVLLDESALPVPAEVAAACDLFGLDPLHVANEGCLVAFVAPRSVAKVLAAMRSVAAGTAAGQVGTVTAGPAGRVAMTTMVGVSRVVDMLVGEALPRIC